MKCDFYFLDGTHPNEEIFHSLINVAILHSVIIRKFGAEVYIKGKRIVNGKQFNDGYIDVALSHETTRIGIIVEIKFLGTNPNQNLDYALEQVMHVL